MSNPRRKLPFVQLDVFTSVPLEGNQLAVFPDGRGLSDAEMQALAREMNLSETTFVIPRDAVTESEKGVRVRIFTVTEELPFAGHPTLGTAMVLRRDVLRGKAVPEGSGADRVVLELNVGQIPVKFTARDGLPFGQMTQRDPEFGQTHSREDVARAVEIPANDIAEDLPIQTVSTGNAFAMVPVKSLAVLQKLAPSWSSMRSYLTKTDAKFFYFVSRETLNREARLQARMIFYGGEDPATGSAAGPCIAWAVQHGVIASEQEALIEQGVEMKRKSRIYAAATREDYKVVNIKVSGHAIEVVRGEIFF